MKKLAKGSTTMEIYGVKIDESLKKYGNDPRVLKKLEDNIKWIEEHGGFEAIFEALERAGYKGDNELPSNQESRYDTALALAEAHEPSMEYGQQKKAEK